VPPFGDGLCDRGGVPSAHAPQQQACGQRTKAFPASLKNWSKAKDLGLHKQPVVNPTFRFRERDPAAGTLSALSVLVGK
jgi:hypothetical protein